MTTAEVKSKRRGDGRVAFLARLDDIRADWNAGRTLAAIYDRQQMAGVICYSQFARYVAHYVAGGSARTARRATSDSAPVAVLEATTGTPKAPRAQPGAARAPVAAETPEPAVADTTSTTSAAAVEPEAPAAPPPQSAALVSGTGRIDFDAIRKRNEARDFDALEREFRRKKRSNPAGGTTNNGGNP